MITKPQPKISDFREYQNGYQDRAAGNPPKSTDRAYFQGYCNRIIFEIDRDQALETIAVA